MSERIALILALAELALKLMAIEKKENPTNEELNKKHEELSKKIERFKDNAS